jgi:hypothetical protein
MRLRLLSVDPIKAKDSLAIALEQLKLSVSAPPPLPCANLNVLPTQLKAVLGIRIRIYEVQIRILLSSSKNRKKNLHSSCL